VSVHDCSASRVVVAVDVGKEHGRAVGDRRAAASAVQGGRLVRGDGGSPVDHSHTMHMTKRSPDVPGTSNSLSSIQLAGGVISTDVMDGDRGTPSSDERCARNARTRPLRRRSHATVQRHRTKWGLCLDARDGLDLPLTGIGSRQWAVATSDHPQFHGGRVSLRLTKAEVMMTPTPPAPLASWQLDAECG
jgi:hypothetical protein